MGRFKNVFFRRLYTVGVDPFISDPGAAKTNALLLTNEVQGLEKCGFRPMPGDDMLN